MQDHSSRSGRFSVAKLAGLLLAGAVLLELWWFQQHDIWAAARRFDSMVDALVMRVFTGSDPEVQASGAESGGLPFDLAALALSIESESQARARAERLLLANRQTALRELQEGVEFMATCGDLNPGFEGCRYDLQALAGGAYTQQLEVGGEGFIIRAEARGAQREDRCHTLIADSNLEIEVFSPDGQRVTAECVPADFLRELAVIPQRAADHTPSRPAPSGAVPLEKDVARISSQADGEIVY